MMSALTALVLVFSAASSQALTGPEEVTGTHGRLVSVECSYEAKYSNYSKFWCRGADWFCDIVVKTSNSEREVTEDRVTIRDSPQTGSFTVVLEGLRLKDAGSYWCGIERAALFDVQIPVSVAVLTDSGQALTGPEEVRGTLGGSVSIECSYEAEYRNHSKFWCQGAHWFCDIVVQTSDSEREVTEGRVTIRDSPQTRTFTVVLEGLRPEDAEIYQCGIERPGSLDVQIPVSVAVLTAPKGNRATGQADATNTSAVADGMPTTTTTTTRAAADGFADPSAQTTSASTSTSQSGVVKEAQPVDGGEAYPVVAVISGAQTTSASTSTSQSGVVKEAQPVDGREADPVVAVISAPKGNSATGQADATNTSAVADGMPTTMTTTTRAAADGFADPSAQTTSASTSTSQSGAVKEAQPVDGREADPVVAVISAPKGNRATGQVDATNTSAVADGMPTTTTTTTRAAADGFADPSAQTTSASTSTSQSGVVKEAQPVDGREADPVVAVISASSPLPPTTISVKTASSPPTPSPSASTNVHSITNTESSGTSIVEHKLDPKTPEGPHDHHPHPTSPHSLLSFVEHKPDPTTPEGTYDHHPHPTSPHSLLSFVEHKPDPTIPEGTYDHHPHPTSPHSLLRSYDWIVLYLLPAGAFLLILLLLTAGFLIRSQMKKKKAFVRSSSPDNGTMQPPDRETAGSQGVSYPHIQFEEAEQQQDDYINMQVICNDPSPEREHDRIV